MCKVLASFNNYNNFVSYIPYYVHSIGGETEAQRD